MKMETNLKGRLRNTHLPFSNGLLPMFEAVVNSIQSIAEANGGRPLGTIVVTVLRDTRPMLSVGPHRKPGAPPTENIVGFSIMDTGAGFTADNMRSFETLDSEYKAAQQCRGVGRLLWLKAFDRARVTSVFRDNDGATRKRIFQFSPDGVQVEPIEDCTEHELTTTITLDGFGEKYRVKAPKTARTIASELLEHCLWYFIRDGSAPAIRVVDGPESFELQELYEEYMLSSAKDTWIEVKGQTFQLTHLRVRASYDKQHSIVWCAGNRVVTEAKLPGKIPGLHGKIQDDRGDFLYHCYVTSPFLDQHVRPERIGFDIDQDPGPLLAETELSLPEVQDAVVAAAAEYLAPYLQEVRKAGRERVERFVAEKAPKYRPILPRIDEDALFVDPEISDNDLEILLHKELSEIELDLLTEGHEVLAFGANEESAEYQSRLSDYLAKADDIKKSDLVNYVFHRKTTLEILEKAVRRGPDGKYVKENLIHEMLMPMGKTSDEVLSDRFNLWIIDERLAFHNYLSSDKPLSSLAITDTKDGKEPDLCALNVFDQPILVGEGNTGMQATITVVELKRPMRDDAGSGEEKNPIEQALGYLQRIRKGEVKTASGRPIVNPAEIPGFCYVICDITPTVERCCMNANLTKTYDHTGYFGYNANYKAYIEVISYDGLIMAAQIRNRAFFDKLSFPVSSGVRNIA